MGDSNTGGGGSVEWEVNAHNARKPPQGPPPACTPKTPTPGRPNPHHQTGADKTVPNSRFTVRIRLPKNPADTFLSELQTAAGSPTGGVVVFTLPIEDIASGFNPPTRDQIRIEWPSDPNPGSSLRMGGVQAKKGTAKKATVPPRGRSTRKRSVRRR